VTMRIIRADLHVHTCLSPCAAAEMGAAAIVGRAGRVGLDMLAICDHNSGENAGAAMEAGRREGLAVIGGMEVTSREEVHILGLFGAEAELMDLQGMLYAHLPGRNDERVFGSQTIVDQWDNPVGTNERLLIGASTLSIEQVVEAIHRRGGLAIASHVDRERFGLIGQLGFIPDGLALDAVELSRRSSRQGEYGFAVVHGSDAHYLEDIGKASTYLMVEEPSFAELRKALHREDGRGIVGAKMEDLSLHILDIVENSIAASASRVEIRVEEDRASDLLTIEITDDGKGMDEEALRNALDPFFTTRTTRKVGLGLPLLGQAARDTGGDIQISSRPGEGTTVRASFRLSHPDCKPMGDIAQTIRTLVAGHPQVDFIYEHKEGESTYRFDTREK